MPRLSFKRRMQLLDDCWMTHRQKFEAFLSYFTVSCKNAKRWALLGHCTLGLKQLRHSRLFSEAVNTQQARRANNCVTSITQLPSIITRLLIYTR